MFLKQAIDLASQEWSTARSKSRLMSESLALLDLVGNIHLDKLDLVKLDSKHWHKQAPATRKRKLAIATRICKVAQLHGWTGKLPRKPKILVDNAKAEYLTQEQFERVIDHTQCEFMRAYLSFLYYTGARPDSEGLRLKREHIRKTLSGWVVDIPQAKTKPRTVPMCEKLRVELEKFGAFELESSASVFKWWGYSYRNISYKWREIVRASLGVDGTGNYSIYILRHSTASNLHDKGASVATIQEILGHSSIQTTMRYVKPSASQKADAMNML